MHFGTDNYYNVCPFRKGNQSTWASNEGKQTITNEYQSTRSNKSRVDVVHELCCPSLNCKKSTTIGLNGDSGFIQVAMSRRLVGYKRQMIEVYSREFILIKSTAVHDA